MTNKTETGLSDEVAPDETARKLALLRRYLRDELERHEAALAERDRIIAERDRTIASLNNELEIRNLQIANLERTSGEQAEGIAWLREEVRLREEKLLAIYGSRLWKTADVYWRARRAVTSPKKAVLAAGRKVLPNSVKRYLKRYWDPNQTISPQEATVIARAAEQAAAVKEVAMQSRGDLAGADLTLRPSRYDVICFSIIDWDFRWQRPQQVMSHLADAGHRVFFLSTTKFPRSEQPAYEITPLRDNVWSVSLGMPAPLDVYGGEMSEAQRAAIVGSIRKLSDDQNISCAVSFIQVPTWAPAAFQLRKELDWHVVYDCMDEWNTFPGMRAALLQEEERLVDGADVLVVSAQRLWEKWHGRNANTVLARNATNFDHFATVPENDILSDVTGPVVGYFGAIADWFDLPLMLRLAKERPQYTFVLLGGVFNVDTSELEKLPNVRILGQKPYELMPTYLSKFTACIIPFVVNAVTEATDPVKFYEYVSQGKPVVAPRMPELYPYSEYLYIASNHDDFLAKVDRAVAEDDPSMRERRIELARENTWWERVGRMEEAIVKTHARVSIVVVTYHNLDLTRLCVDSVFRNTPYPNFELIIVDNASTDGTVEYLRELEEKHPNVRVILNDRNLGFARANNQGLEVATGDYLVLLNNDTVVPNGWIPKLLRHLREEKIGLVVSVTNFSGNESRIDVPYRNLDEMEDFARQYTRDHDGRYFDIRVAAMYCVAMRRDTFAKVGPLDDQFSVGMFEDDDYSHRMRLAGYRVVCVEDTFVHHFGQASFKKLSQSEYQAIWDRNQALYEKKWGAKWEAHTLRK